MKKILVIGDIILDHYIYGKIDRMSPEFSNVPILDENYQVDSLGGAANVAANIKALNKENAVCLSGLINHRIENELDEYDIKHKKYSLFTPEKLIKKRFIDLNNNSQILRVDIRKQNDPNDILDLQEMVLTPLVKKNFKSFDCIVISDYCKGVIDSWLIRSLSEYSKPIFIDTKKPDLLIWKDLKNYVVKINSKEWSCSKNPHLIKQLIVTKGVSGCSYCDNGNWTNFSTNPVENADVTGAGDSFLAGLVCKYLETNSIKDSIEYANKVAYISVSKPGTSIVYKSEVEDEM